MQGDPRYRMWTRLASWFRWYIRRWTEKLKTIFLVSGIFPGKAESVILLGFECTINSQNLIKIVGVIFEKIKILNFFLMWTTLNFRVRVKTRKKGSRYFREDPRYRVERYWWVGLGPALGAGKKLKIYFSSFRDFSGKSR